LEYLNTHEFKRLFHLLAAPTCRGAVLTKPEALEAKAGILFFIPSFDPPLEDLPFYTRGSGFQPR